MPPFSFERTISQLMQPSDRGGAYVKGREGGRALCKKWGWLVYVQQRTLKKQDWKISSWFRRGSGFLDVGKNKATWKSF